MKVTTRFVCQECGYASSKWLGRCPGCGQWQTMVEEKTAVVPAATAPRAEVTPITRIPLAAEPRIGTGIGELDRVLGGGLVPGSLVLVGGDPGIGKSTLLLQAAHRIATATGSPVLYLTAEESLSQTRLRAERLQALGETLYLLAENNLEAVEPVILELRPNVVVVDSIQTVYLPSLSSAPGSVAQVRESAAYIMRFAKTENITFVLVGHVTKSGGLAGPRVLEHLVDTVLYFEGDRYHVYRLLRAVKNRFGSTNEVGVFAMGEPGLVEVANPSVAFLSQRSVGGIGSQVVATWEGSRPLLVEIQALVTESKFGNPRRLATGVELNRVLLLLAVLEKRAGLNLANQDVYVNVVGGLRLDEPAADLAICTAVASSLLNRAIDPGLMVAGEVGLTGEIRAISQIEKRVAEAAKMGFQTCLLPWHNVEGLCQPAGLELVPVKWVREALDMILT